MENKVCTHCKISKTLDCFSKNKRKVDGYHYYCKVCAKLHKDKIREHCNEYTRQWRKDNKEKVKENNKIYKEQNKDRIKKHNANKPKRKIVYTEKKKEYAKKYSIRNRERENEYEREHRKNNILYKLASNLRCRIGQVVRKDNKKGKTLDILGCSSVEFKSYLESLFQPEMSWENWGRGEGKWHIDHIVPCASFDLTDSEQVNKCFHYTNMRPLWEFDNLSKNSYHDGIRHTFKK